MPTYVDGPLPIASVVTTSGALVAGQHTPVNGAGGIVTLTLPTVASAASGARLAVELQDTKGGTAVITGSIRGTTSSRTLREPGQVMEFRVDSTGASWYPAGEIIPISYLDKRYAIPANPLGILHAAAAARNTAPVNIVFTGSSTTAGTAANANAYRYVNRLTGHMQAAWPSCTGTEQGVVSSTSATWGTIDTSPGIHVFNGGEGSTTSATYMTDTEAGNIAALNPAMVVHMIGANDFATNVDPATYKTNVAGRITKLQSLQSTTANPCVHVLVQTYQRWDVSSPTYNWAEYGHALQQIAEANPTTVAYINLASWYAYAGAPSTDPFDIIATDLIHQNDEGHDLMARTLAIALGIPARRGGVLVSLDNFIRPNSTALQTTMTGEQWYVDTGAITVTGNIAVATGATIASLYTGRTNVDITATIAWTGTPNSATGIGLCTYMYDQNNRWVFFVNGTLTGWSLTKYLSGSRTDVLTGTMTGYTPTAGAYYSIRLVAMDGHLTGWFDTVQRVTYSMTNTERSQYGDSGRQGLRISGTDNVGIGSWVVKTT